LKIEILERGGACFPESLKKIPDPPDRLYCLGNVDCLFETRSVAVVGTRKPTVAGKRIAENFGRQLAKRGWVVVSGLALGCDTAAHEGCLEGGGRTVAVLPGGIRNVYPSENQKLAERIVRSGGCLVSEYPPEARPEPYRFIERDRLQSGLSLGTVVVETDLEGGAMHTARFCLAQKRLLACVVPSKRFSSHPMAQGNWKLIREKRTLALKTPADFFERVVVMVLILVGVWAHPAEADPMKNSYEKATFAAGCFWGVEKVFSESKGVAAIQVGYTGGRLEDPTYEDVCTGRTGHAEAVEITYDPSKVRYENLLEIFFRHHDPTTPNRQGPDIGSQYRSAIFHHTPEQEKAARKVVETLERSRIFKNPVVTEIKSAGEFYRAEEYHQRYLKKNPHGYCSIQVQPDKVSDVLRSSVVE
jgi:peptide-methionine (S)-S-oxide reductase